MMWMTLTVLGAVGLVLLPLSLAALFARSRSPEDEVRGLGRIPYGLSMPAALLSLTFIFLGLNAGAFAPAEDEIKHDIAEFDERFERSGMRDEAVVVERESRPEAQDDEELDGELAEAERSGDPD